MKKTNKNIVLIVMTLLIATLPLALAEDAPSMYFVPDGGSGNCGETETIDLMVNSSNTSTTAFAYVHFDPACINMTDVDFTGSPWQPYGGQAGWSNQGDYIIDMGGSTVSDGIHGVTFA